MSRVVVRTWGVGGSRSGCPGIRRRSSDCVRARAAWCVWSPSAESCSSTGIVPWSRRASVSYEVWRSRAPSHADLPSGWRRVLTASGGAVWGPCWSGTCFAVGVRALAPRGSSNQCPGHIRHRSTSRAPSADPRVYATSIRRPIGSARARKPARTQEVALAREFEVVGALVQAVGMVAHEVVEAERGCDAHERRVVEERDEQERHDGREDGALGDVEPAALSRDGICVEGVFGPGAAR